jgi:hypothetical protein
MLHIAGNGNDVSFDKVAHGARDHLLLLVEFKHRLSFE